MIKGEQERGLKCLQGWVPDAAIGGRIESYRSFQILLTGVGPITCNVMVMH